MLCQSPFLLEVCNSCNQVYYSTFSCASHMTSLVESVSLCRYMYLITVSRKPMSTEGHERKYSIEVQDTHMAVVMVLRPWIPQECPRLPDPRVMVAFAPSRVFATSSRVSSSTCDVGYQLLHTVSSSLILITPRLSHTPLPSTNIRDPQAEHSCRTDSRRKVSLTLRRDWIATNTPHFMTTRCAQRIPKYRRKLPRRTHPRPNRN